MTKRNRDWAERIGSLPKRAETWMGGIVQLPLWVKEGERAMRPSAAVWMSREAGTINMSPPVSREEADFDLLIETVLGERTGNGMRGYRPELMLVADAELANYLKAALAGIDTDVEFVKDDAPLQMFVRMMSEQMGGESKVPPALDAEGVTAERMRGFAEAAAEFHRAAPWRRLTDEDLVAVESPTPPKHLSHFVVMGSGGQEFGLSFFQSPLQHRQMYTAADPRDVLRKGGTVWSVTYDAPENLPLADVDLFDRLAFPTAADDKYPLALGINLRTDEVSRPGAAELALMEGLLRALARTREAELDEGRWTCRVPTADGETEFILSLPLLLKRKGGAAKKSPAGAAKKKAVKKRRRRP